MNFLFNVTIRNIKHKYGKSTLIILVSILIVILLNLFMGNINYSQTQLEELASVSIINVNVSNLNGTQITALRINDDRIRQFESSPHITNLHYSIELLAGFGLFDFEERHKYLNINILAVNCISAVKGLDVDDTILGKDIDLSFLTGNEPLCLLTSRFAEEHNLSNGDKIDLTLYSLEYPSIGSGEVKMHPLIMSSFTIAGIIESDSIQADMILSIDFVRKAYEELEMAFFPTAASFIVANPLKLNEFKKEMKSFGLLSTISTADFSHTAPSLIVNDKIFIESAEHLRKLISLQKVLLPFIFIVIAFIAFIISYLSMQNQRLEFALKRSLGTDAKVCFAIFLLEHTILVLIGGFIGAITVLWVFSNISLTVVFISVGSVFICFICGTVVTLYMLSRFSVMNLLSKND